jgi:hypothetical protein
VKLERLRPADWLTGIAGLLSFLLLWAPWYGVSDGTVSGWSSLAIIDVFVLVTAALAIVTWVITALRDSPELPIAFDVLTAPVASLTTLLVLTRLLDTPGGKAITDRHWGVVAAFVAVLATAAGAWWAMRDERAPGLRPGPEVRAMLAPPAGTGGEPAGT